MPGLQCKTSEFSRVKFYFGGLHVIVLLGAPLDITALG